MFVYNIKFSSGKIFKIILFLIIIIALVMTGISIYKTFSNNTSTNTNSNDVYTINSTNYTNILKAVHENLDTYIGQKINFSGYVYYTSRGESSIWIKIRQQVRQRRGCSVSYSAGQGSFFCCFFSRSG